MRLRVWTLALIGLLAWESSWADFAGQVIAISDGDTLTLLNGREQVKVRLADIDAPEARQAFGMRSKQYLSSICFSKPAQVIYKGRDRYGRIIGKVACSGIDAATAQVRAGMAWVFVRYAPKDSPLF